MHAVHCIEASKFLADVIVLTETKNLFDKTTKFSRSSHELQYHRSISTIPPNCLPCCFPEPFPSPPIPNLHLDEFHPLSER